MKNKLINSKMKSKQQDLHSTKLRKITQSWKSAEWIENNTRRWCEFEKWLKYANLQNEKKILAYLA